MNRLLSTAAVLATLTAATEASAASLPEHDPLRIVVVSDEVNPHGLSDADLTQPGDLRTALTADDSGLNIDTLIEVDSACIDDAVTALDTGDVDVFVYFAHVAATDCGGGEGQAALTNAVRSHLEKGGGVVVFHHGLFTAGGKTEILQLLGASASEIAWEPDAGQDVIAVAPDHFVTTNGLDYPSTRPFGEPNFGIPDGDYPSFRNAPDERYPGTQLLLNGEEDIEILFASDYAGAQVLGYDLQRPGWQGHTVAYQPGEYQPLALDDRDGPNFQVLANAIYYVGTTQDEGPDPGSDTDDGDTSGDDPSTGTPDPTTGDGDGDGDDGDDAGSDPTASSMGTAGNDAGAETDTEGASADTSTSGCHVGAAPTSGFGFGVLLILAGLRRRRAAVVRR